MKPFNELLDATDPEYIQVNLKRPDTTTLRNFLRAAINPDNWEHNPLLQDYMTPWVVDAIDEVLKYNDQVIIELCGLERAMSHVIQTVIQDRNVTLPSDTSTEIMNIRNNLRNNIRQLGYKGQF